MVCGMKPILVIVTSCVCDGTSMLHGVRQVWPCAVRTSAPGGLDSKRKVCVAGVEGWDERKPGIDGVGIQSGIAEHPASAAPITAAVAATTSPTRDMSLSVPNG
jgi:hypothetical protein